VYDGDDIRVNKSIMILEKIHNILMTLIYLGEPLERWKHVTTCLIEKVPIVSRIDKLRVIHIYEADYNLLLKIMWARKQCGIQVMTTILMKDNLEVSQDVDQLCSITKSIEIYICQTYKNTSGNYR
jgi:hypothetical protein